MKEKNIFNNILICPNCRFSKFERSNHDLVCKKCGTIFNINPDYIDLRLDRSKDTQLDHAKYDEYHNVNKEHSLDLYRMYNQIFQDCNVNTSGSLLEIACGSGHLTMGFLDQSEFSDFHISDISPKFMRMARERLKDYPNFSKLKCYLFDANLFPFKDEIFDVVIGNSVLHHFAHFEKSLEESYRVLREGGIAVYGEPILDTNCFVSLAAALIYEIDKQNETPKLSNGTSDLLLKIGKISIQKRIHLDSDRMKLDEIEDKFQFPVAYMRKLAFKLGFSSFDCLTPWKIDDFGKLIRGGLYRIFNQHQLEVNELDEYRFVFDCIEATFGKAMKDYQNALFSIFYFKK